jgi:hypothetical protein
MPPSRATIANRKNDCARLQLQLDEARIWARVAYDDARGRYVVTRIPQAGDAELCAGRYEVVYAWIRGYLLGRFDAISPAEPERGMIQTDTTPTTTTTKENV